MATDSDPIQLAILSLLARQRENAAPKGGWPEKTELILHKAGMDKTDIAQAVGKNLGAVTKAIQRSEKKS